ncbi:hypothetical protein XELAEV_18002978mg [Xenopus laevis]|uniref:Uncharacterized protein n=1 Tax=Xenopus laevis TaxID=8355 RepID=A0A974GYJ2_XENLA|nr:hypothetical protein XELAEV_18002978mg [Xenopus laevis]
MQSLFKNQPCLQKLPRSLEECKKKSCPNIEQLKENMVETVPEKQIQVCKQAETAAQSNVIPTPSEQQKGGEWKEVRRENKKRVEVRRETRARRIEKKNVIGKMTIESQNRYEVLGKNHGGKRLKSWKKWRRRRREKKEKIKYRTRAGKKSKKDIIRYFI